MHAYIHFFCLIQLQNTEIYNIYRKSAQKYRDMNCCSYRPALVYYSVFVRGWLASLHILALLIWFEELACCVRFIWITVFVMLVTWL